jgi:hypothetical protein
MVVDRESPVRGVAAGLQTSAWRQRAAAVVEVCAVFAVAHVAYRAFKQFTELGRAEVESGLNYSARTQLYWHCAEKNRHTWRNSDMVKRKEEAIRIIRVKKGESLKSLYAKLRRRFTAADLAKYCEDEPMIPAEQILAELEAIQREETSKRKRKPKNARRK